MKESDIVHEEGIFWVMKSKVGYSVMVSGITHSESDSVYSLDDDGKSLAIARCKYLAISKKS